MRTIIREAIKTCRRHAVAGIELPYAHFTAGRLNLLLEKGDDALGYYARGIRHCLAGIHCVPADVLAGEIQWLKRIHFGVKPPPKPQRVSDLLALGQQASDGSNPAGTGSPLSPPALIIAGGAAGMDAATVKKIRPLVLAALADFRGTAIAGGTTAGVPGCVGDVAGELAHKRRKQ